MQKFHIGSNAGADMFWLEAKLEMVPVLLELGMTAEQIAARLGLEVSIVTGRLNR